jgi:hypothetical protein
MTESELENPNNGTLWFFVYGIDHDSVLVGNNSGVALLKEYYIFVNSRCYNCLIHNGVVVWIMASEV